MIICNKIKVVAETFFIASHVVDYSPQNPMARRQSKKCIRLWQLMAPTKKFTDARLDLVKASLQYCLMEETLHQICKISHYLQGFIHPRVWCRISEPPTVSSFFSTTKLSAVHFPTTSLSSSLAMLKAESLPAPKPQQKSRAVM